MKRALVLLAVLLSIAAVTGVWAVNTWLPAELRDRAEAALAEALGGPIRLGEVRARLRPGLEIEARGLQGWPDERGPALSAEVVRIDLAGRQLLLGRVHVDGVLLENARVRIGRDPEGRLRPAALADLVTPAPADAGEASPLARIRRAVHDLRTFTAPGLQLAVRDAILEWSEGEGRPVRLAIAEGRLAVGSAPEDLSLAATAQVLGEDGAASGSVAVTGWRAADAALALDLALGDLDLHALAASFPGVIPTGLVARASGSASLRLPRAAGAAPPSGAGLAPFPASASLDLHLDGLRLPPAEAAARAFEAKRASLRASLSLEPTRLRLERAEISTDTDSLSVSGALALPADDDARAELAVTLPRLGVARVRELAALLPRDTARAAAAALEPLEAGEVAPLELAAAAPLSRWRAVLAGDDSGVPRELELSARVEGVRVRLDAGDRLENVSASVRFSNDRLDLRGVRGALAGDPLPPLDASFQGVADLLGAERFSLRPPAPAGIPGLAPVRRLLSRDPADPDRTPRWTGLRIDADLLHHPALAAPLEDAHAQLVPTPDGVHWIVESALWGGVPIDAEGDYFDPPEERIVVSVRAVGRRAPRPALAPGGDWMRGRFALAMAPPPRSAKLAAAEGWFRARDLELRLFETTARLAPGGELQGELALDLSSAADVPFESRFVLASATVDGVRQLFGAEDDSFTGALEGQGELRGRLADGRPLFEGARGWVRAVATDGELRGRLPFFVAVASVSETLNPFAGRDRIRYRRADGEVTLQDGRVSSDTISVDSPDLRLYLAGSVGVAPPHPTEAVLGLFFFGKVSSMIGKVPILNRVLLGESQSLAGAYFELDGPWTAPRASIVPLKSLAATGPAGFVLEGVPSFVRGGIDAIESIFRRDAATRPDEAPGPSPSPGPVGAAGPAHRAEAVP